MWLFLTASEFHCDQKLLYLWLLSAMSFHSGLCPASTSCRMGPISGWLFALFWEPLFPRWLRLLLHSSYLFDVCLSLDFVTVGTRLLQGLPERAKALLCFRPWRKQSTLAMPSVIVLSRLALACKTGKWSTQKIWNELPANVNSHSRPFKVISPLYSRIATYTHLT
jgi:hypothetical protein